MSKCIAIDLDGTLAYYEGWMGTSHIGDPVEPIVQQMRAQIAAGDTFVIFTARLFNNNQTQVRSAIDRWLEEHNLPYLEVTGFKEPKFDEIWDDRAVRIEKNTGRFCGGLCSDEC